MGRVRCKKKLKAFDPFAPASRKACLGMSGAASRSKARMDLPPDMPKKKRRRTKVTQLQANDKTQSKEEKRIARETLGLLEGEVCDIEVENPFGNGSLDVCKGPITGPGVWKPGMPKWSRQGDGDEGGGGGGEEDDDIQLGEGHNRGGQTSKSKAKAKLDPSKVTLDIKQEPGESLRDYKRRIRTRTSQMLIQHKKDSNLRYQKRKGYMKDKMKSKNAKASGPEEDSDDELRPDRGERKQETVRFGDVAERPPEFKFTPKKVGGNKHKKKADTFKARQDVSKQKEMEKLRNEAQAAYARMKEANRGKKQNMR